MSRRRPGIALAFLIASAIVLGSPSSGAPGEKRNGGHLSSASLIVDGSFERGLLRPAKPDEMNVWLPISPAKAGAKIAVAASAGRKGSHCAHYRQTATVRESVHLDQIVAVKKHTFYEVCAWVRCAGDLNPVLAVATVQWKTLPMAIVECGTGDEWRQVRLVFDSGENDRVRLEWFGGAQGKAGSKLYVAAAGDSYLDDVAMTPVSDTPAALREAFKVSELQVGQEIDLRKVRRLPLGKPTPLRPIVCRDGVLSYDDGTEVALWGANFQTALSWEYFGRLKRAGVPFEAAALKRVTDENLDQLVMLGAQVIRAHLLPADFTDAEGTLRDSVFLDVLDHCLAASQKRGLYVYLTLINDMDTYFMKDSFMAGHTRRQWLFDQPFLDRAARYAKAIMEHRNRYSGVPYKDDPTIAVVEVMNEPAYPDGQAIATEPSLKRYREAFDAWAAQNQVKEFPEAAFRAYRYQTVRRAIDQLAGAIRSTGCAKPVVWNLNWPGMISEREDVFQAAADSSVDAVSFCLYPGQSDVPEHYWDHPADLSGKNYLPYLARLYGDYKLRWVLGQRFAKKAKLVYEFETFYNQASYLYPGMARLFRALGVQIAPMWQYTLSPAAEYRGGSHYLNAYCTPPKAISFRIAAWVFSHMPRYSPYDVEAEDTMVFRPCALSYHRNLSVLQTAERLYYSQSLERLPFSGNGEVKEIVGCGSSPLVSYGGTGMYEVRDAGGALEIRINPDVRYLSPPWETRWKADKSCLLDSATPHRFTVRLPAWQGDVEVRKLEAGHEKAVRTDGPALSFEATPGQYRVVRKKP